MFVLHESSQVKSKDADGNTIAVAQTETGEVGDLERKIEPAALPV